LEGKKKKKKKRIEVGKKYQSVSKSFMSIQESSYKYEKYEMAVDGAHNDVLVAINNNEEVEIVECQVRI